MIKYFTPRNTETEKRIYVSTIGYEEIDAGERYPSGLHPEGYYFDPAEGRVLQEYQIVYFTDGAGTLKLRGGEYALTGGTVLILPPGAWHSYYPHPDTGWKQYWICFKGDFVDEWMRDTSCSLDQPLFRVGLNAELLGLFRKALEIAGKQDNLNLIGGLINYLVNLVCNVALTSPADGFSLPSDNAGKIERACRRMEETLADDVRIEDIAAEVGLSYPLFRKLFRQMMNMSAQQYLLQLRVQRAADMLMSTDEPVKNVAYTLGYDQPAYFSYCFHKVMGMTPREYRDTLRK